MTHHPDCLSLDNVLGRHDCDCKPKGVHGLMHAQMQAEWELAHRFPPWVEDRDPPQSGSYLVRVVSPDGPTYVTLDIYQDGGWPRIWGRITGWMQLPPV